MITNLERRNLIRFVKYYKRQASHIQMALRRKKSDWGKYQGSFNSDVDLLFRQIMNFEKRALRNGRDEDVERLKQFFIKYFRKSFYHGTLSKWSIDKPYGYAGDFRVIDAIYSNDPQTTGYDRLFDNYFQMSAISVAVRNRKEDFKKEILAFIKRNPDKKIKIMNLASGPCREIYELFLESPGIKKRVHFDCYDLEPCAHRYAKVLLKGNNNVSFFIQNALRLAAAKKSEPKYDFIYSMGLFDYLNFKIASRLVASLRSLLRPGGELLIADVRDRYLNPSVFYMEWAGGWDLVYRKDSEFENIFLSAGFQKKKLEKQYEQQGILQYIRAEK